jgi:hypothetical protein
MPNLGTRRARSGGRRILSEEESGVDRAELESGNGPTRSYEDIAACLSSADSLFRRFDHATIIGHSDVVLS